MGYFFPAKSLVGVLSIVVSIALTECAEFPQFSCQPKSGDSLPPLPAAFSTDIRFNVPTILSTVEVRYFKDTEGKRIGLEVFARQRHVKYILHGKQLLLIKYSDKDYPSCTVKSSSTLELEKEDTGPDDILSKMFDALNKANEFKPSFPENNNGIYIKKWERCSKNPLINVSLGYTEINWRHPRTSKDQKMVVQVEAQIGEKNFVVGLFDNFTPDKPADAEFQPPPGVYCAGFREDQKPPSIPDHFSYDAELLMYDTRDAPAPFIVSHRSVYYDYPSGISRIDLHDPLAEIQDAGSKLVVKGISVIHDFNSSIQYNFDLTTGKCEVEDFQVTIDVAEEKETKETAMLTGLQYFSLDAKKISYNGRFTTRGYLSDVYTAAVPHLDGTTGKSVYTWYFSSVNTQIVENDKLEKNVLLHMSVHAETGSGNNARIEMNMYNFQKSEPNGMAFYVFHCYNDSNSKNFIMTFPAIDALRDAEGMLKLSVHNALRDFTGVSKQRIFVSEVLFNKQFMFAEFKILESPHVLRSKINSKELTLQGAIDKIKASVSDGSFKFSVTTEEGVYVIIPLKDGFNELAGDRTVKDKSGYNEGSVIGLTIGMLLLGFVVGGLALNLIISRKYGVSLFGKTGAGLDNFNNPLNESAM